MQTCNEVPQPQLKPVTLEYLEELEGSKPTISVAGWGDKLIASLDLTGLKKWPEEQAKCACKLLKKYHDVFSLEDNELGCMNQVKHSIKVTDEEPFKKHFW